MEKIFAYGTPGEDFKRKKFKNNNDFVSRNDVPDIDPDVEKVKIPMYEIPLKNNMGTLKIGAVVENPNNESKPHRDIEMGKFEHDILLKTEAVFASGNLAPIALLPGLELNLGTDAFKVDHDGEFTLFSITAKAKASFSREQIVGTFWVNC